MTIISKIRFFLITFTLTFTLASCNKQNDVIPYSPVNFYLNLDDPQFIDLISFGGIVLVDENTNNLGTWSAGGYDRNGIIIFAGVDEYYAYDRTCPHDYAVNNKSIRVNIDTTYTIYAVCPECKTKYSLATGGTPVSGVGRYPLKNYKTSFDGRSVRVWN